MKKGTTLQLTEIRKMLELARHGLTVAAIARIVERASTTVANTLRDYEVEVKPTERTTNQLDKAFDLVRQGIRPMAYSDALKQRRVSTEEPETKAELTDAEEESSAILDRLKRWARGEPEEPPASTSDISIYTCADCGGAYEMTASHIGWYESKGLSQPRRCQPCRDARRTRHDSSPLSRDQIDDLRGQLVSILVTLDHASAQMAEDEDLQDKVS